MRPFCSTCACGEGADRTATSSSTPASRCNREATTSDAEPTKVTRRVPELHSQSEEHLQPSLSSLHARPLPSSSRRRWPIGTKRSRLLPLFAFLLISLLIPGAAAQCTTTPIDDAWDEAEDGRWRRLDCPSLAALRDFEPAGLPNVTHLNVQCASPYEEDPKLPRLALHLPQLQKLVAKRCGEAGVRALRFLRHGRLKRAEFADNAIETFEWRLARAFNTKVLDLARNKIVCTCANRWIFDSLGGVKRQHSLTLALQLPIQVRIGQPTRASGRCPADCPVERTELQPAMVNTTMNHEATVRCSFSVPFDRAADFDPTDVFAWLMDTEETKLERGRRWNISVENTRTLRLSVRNLSSSDLGMVVCRCLHCTGPSYAISELRFDTPITSDLSVGEHKDVSMHVHGYPLENLTMAVTRLKDNTTEVHSLHLPSGGGEAQFFEFFNGTFVSRYEADHSMAFLKYFSLFVKECNTCRAGEHPPAEDYEIQVCTGRPNDCTQVQTRIGDQVHLDFTGGGLKTNNNANAVAYLFLLLVILCTIGGLILSTLHYYRKDKTASKFMTAVGWHKKGRRYRRTSRNTMRTEETSLRDDTLSATLSNYSLQHVPIIEREHLILETAIGKGKPQTRSRAFGEVFTGEWLARGIRVAVKTLHNVQVDAQMDKEAALLAALDHDNVVKMFGVAKAPEQQGLYLVLELMNMGDLKTYVKQRQPQCDNYSQFPPALLPTELINIAQQVATGLCYIASQQIVHRDLAARNCLVSGETDVRVCSPAFRPPITVKISDFGMSRRLYSQAEYYKMGDKQTALPVRWLPPEALECGRFTPASDMWSFGITLFELFTFGSMPYGDLSNNEALMAVISGVRPTVPPKCPPAIAELMKDCWKTAPDERPVADDALIRLKEIQ